MAITADALAALKAWDTPTICNALELIVPERRGHGFTIEHLHCPRPALPPIVGRAKTATIRAAAPNPVPPEEAKTTRAAYYEYVADAELPTVTVIEDLDPTPGIGSFWGEVNTAIHKGLGSEGLVTNGSIRDLDDCAPGFQMLTGKYGPSHAFVHVVAFGLPVSVHGMDVNDGDIIHADQHGAVVIPDHAVDRIAEAIDLLVRKEAVILEAARRDDFNIDILKKAMASSAEIH